MSGFINGGPYLRGGGGGGGRGLLPDVFFGCCFQVDALIAGSAYKRGVGGGGGAYKRNFTVFVLFVVCNLDTPEMSRCEKQISALSLTRVLLRAAKHLLAPQAFNRNYTASCVGILP